MSRKRSSGCCCLSAHVISLHLSRIGSYFLGMALRRLVKSAIYPVRDPRFAMLGVGCSEPSVTFGYFRILTGWFRQRTPARAGSLGNATTGTRAGTTESSSGEAPNAFMSHVAAVSWQPH